MQSYRAEAAEHDDGGRQEVELQAAALERRERRTDLQADAIHEEYQAEGVGKLRHVVVDTDAQGGEDDTNEQHPRYAEREMPDFRPLAQPKPQRDDQRQKQGGLGDAGSGYELKQLLHYLIKIGVIIRKIDAYILYQIRIYTQTLLAD